VIRYKRLRRVSKSGVQKIARYIALRAKSRKGGAS